jgi:ER lumen protein retaining receptor
MGSDDTLGKVKDPVVAIIKWVKSRSSREKLMMGVAAGMLVNILSK